MKSWQIKKKLIAGAIKSPLPAPVVAVPAPVVAVPAPVVIDAPVNVDASVAGRVAALENKAMADGQLFTQQIAQLQDATVQQKLELNSIQERLRTLEDLAARVTPLLPPVVPPTA